MFKLPPTWTVTKTVQDGFDRYEGVCESHMWPNWSALWQTIKKDNFSVIGFRTFSVVLDESQKKHTFILTTRHSDYGEPRPKVS
jgi:hypothetical protein